MNIKKSFQPILDCENWHKRSRPNLEEFNSPSVLVLSSNSNPEGMGHVLAPTPPSDGGMEINFPAWASLASASYQIDLRVDSISSNPDNLTQAIQTPILVAEKATFVDLAEVALRTACASSQRLKRVIDVNLIDAVIFSVDSRKELFDENGNMNFDRSRMGHLTPFAFFDTIGDTNAVFDRYLEGSTLKWQKYLRSFFNYTQHEIINCGLKKPRITPDTSVQNWLKSGKSPVPHNLRNTNLKAPLTLVCHLVSRTQMEDFVLNQSFHTEAWKTDLFLPNWVLDSEQGEAIQVSLNASQKCIEVTLYEFEDKAVDSESSGDEEVIEPRLKQNHPQIFNLLASKKTCPQFYGKLPHPRNQNWSTNEYTQSLIYFYKTVFSPDSPSEMYRQLRQLRINRASRDFNWDERYSPDSLLDISSQTNDHVLDSFHRRLQCKSVHRNACSDKNHQKSYAPFTWESHVLHGGVFGQKQRYEVSILKALAEFSNQLTTASSTPIGDENFENLPILGYLIECFDWETAFKSALMDAFGQFLNGPIRVLDTKSSESTPHRGNPRTIETVLKNSFTSILESAWHNLVFIYLDFAEQVKAKFSIDLLNKNASNALQNLSSEERSKIWDLQREIAHVKIIEDETYFRITTYAELDEDWDELSGVVTEDEKSWWNVKNALKWFSFNGASVDVRFLVCNLANLVSNLLDTSQVGHISQEVADKVINHKYHRVLIYTKNFLSQIYVDYS